MIEDAGLTARIAELEDYFDRARLMAHPKEVAKETLDNLIDTVSNNLQEVAYLFVEEIKENTEKKAAKEKEDEKIELEDIDSVGMAVSFAAQSIHDGQQYLDDKKEEYGEAYSAKVEECKTAAQDMWSDGVKGLQSDLKKKGYDIPELDGLVDAGNMALEKVSVAVDLPNRDVNLDKLEADIGKALKKLVDLKPDEYYNLTYEKLPVTAKTLLVTAELGTEIATGEFTSYDQLKANTKENFKNLAKGGEYCITDMIAGAIKLPNMGAQLISSKHTKHMNQLQDIADCRGSFESYADIKLEKIENATHSIESAAVTAGADFINSSKEEKYKTLGYAGTTIAMFADAAFSLAEGIKAARVAAKAAKAAEAIVEGGEVIAETAAETGEVLAEAGESASKVGEVVPSGVSEGGSNSEVSYVRPSGFRKGVRDKVWDNAQNANGDVIDPVTKKVMDKSEPWDMGHKPGYEFRKHKQSAESRGISRKQFLDEYNNPDHYRPELPSSNRSHKGEDITDNYFGE